MYLKISDTLTLSQLSNRVSHDNVGAILAANGLSWGPNVGSAFTAKCNAVINSYSTRSGSGIGWEQQYSILNKLTQDSDVFEYACSMGANAWQVFSSLATFPGMLNIPSTVSIASGNDILGDGNPVPQSIYNAVMNDLITNHAITDLSVFNDYSNASAAQSSVYGDPGTSLFESFHIPWGEVTLWSSISGDTIDFPVYPETIDDGTSAEYTTMPDMIYQYEPWQVYKSSGPRSPKFSFHFHRDMWTGDHRDGKANELIRFCQAQCYPDYQGSAVVAPTVSLFIGGSRMITGIMTSVNVSWSGPLGLDKFYLECTLDISITEVSPEPLTYQSVRTKPLIG